MIYQYCLNDIVCIEHNYYEWLIIGSSDGVKMWQY